MIRYLDFEKDIEKLDVQISELDKSKENYQNTKDKFLKKKITILDKIYSNLSAWDKVQIARHPQRPHTLDYINNIFQNIVYLHGDKKFSDDSAKIVRFFKLID